MSRDVLEAHQREAWVSYLSSLVEVCERRFCDAARLVGFDLTPYPLFHNRATRRLDMTPLWPVWSILCRRYNEEVFDPQKDLFLKNDGPDAVFSRFIHWELLPELAQENDIVRNTLRVVGLLPCSDQRLASHALMNALAEFPLSKYQHHLHLDPKL